MEIKIEKEVSINGNFRYTTWTVYHGMILVANHHKHEYIKKDKYECLKKIESIAVTDFEEWNKWMRLGLKSDIAYASSIIVDKYIGF